jgi:hypothetical protein
MRRYFKVWRDYRDGKFYYFRNEFTAPYWFTLPNKKALVLWLNDRDGFDSLFAWQGYRIDLNHGPGNPTFPNGVWVTHEYQVNANLEPIHGQNFKPQASITGPRSTSFEAELLQFLRALKRLGFTSDLITAIEAEVKQLV